jgi:hypothetical protein
VAYVPLVLEPEPKPLVGGLIRRLEDHYFRDVHAMLRLPAPVIDVAPGCNFALAQVLAAVISGVSVTLFEHSGGKGKRFTRLLVEYYPWEEEPLAVHNPEESAGLIYSLVRNPLTHDLGLDLETKQRTKSVIIKRLTTGQERSGHTEAGVEALEATPRPGNLSPTITIEADRVVLLVEAFYWGTREMLRRLNADPDRATAAEAFLDSLEQPRG